ncbi:MAG: TetR/AcrR family transcriptional regulator [Bradymonadia bacterium]
MSDKVLKKEDPPRRKRGRPEGRTAAGAATRARLFDEACVMLAEVGYAGMTLRALAERAELSAGAVYKHFPNKAAIVLALYEDLSRRFAEEVSLPSGPWRLRFEAALDSSISTLAPHRDTLAELVPVLVGDRAQGLFAEGTAFARARVEGVFLDVARHGRPKPSNPDALGRVLYTVHLAVILFWLLDRSPAQRATDELRALLAQALPPAALALRVPGASRVLSRLSRLIEEGLLGLSGTP